MRPKSYVGITGFTSREEVDGVLEALPPESDTLVMVGVLASGKTIYGQPNKWPMRYPPAEELGSIFSDYAQVLNLLHFNTKRVAELLLDMEHAYELAGPYCHGFQLNIAWPDKAVLSEFRVNARAGHGVIVLQCGANALDQLGRDPARIAHRIAEYEGVIDYALIDPSGGLGQEFDVAFVEECFREGHRIPPSIGMGIAGGLHAGNLTRLEPLLSRHDFSIDAEGRLRDEDDDLDIGKAQAYLYEASEAFRKRQAILS